jgi:hypothetical protein
MEGNDSNLRTIEYWVSNKSVRLLIPLQLEEEWKKQKSTQQKQIIQNQEKALPKIRSFKNLVKLETNYVEQKISRIDNLFEKTQKIKPSKSVLAEVTKRFTEGKAPFHRKNNNSNADALIFLTTINFIQKCKERSFVFISMDGDDYSDETNSANLHQDFNTPGIEIKYLVNIGAAIQLLKNELGDNPSLLSTQKGEFVPIFYLLPDLHNYNLINQIYYSLTKYTDQISFIPNNILIRIFPFKIEDSKYDFAYHSPFQINTNNKDLVQLFHLDQNLIINTPQEIDAKFDLKKKTNKEKINEIKRLLNNNLVFGINSVDNSLETEIKAKGSKTCTCVLCSYNRFDFLSSFQQLTLTPLEDERETMKHAYVHFQFGNFIPALKLFYHVFNLSDKQKKYIRAFICLYNIKRLTNYIKGYLIEVDIEASRIMDEIDKISFENYKLSASTDLFLKENIEWIQNNEFYNTAFQKIVTVLSKIQDHYYIQLEGGWSTNSNYDIMLSEFAEIDTFLDKNYVIYNNYSDFTELANAFLKGLFTIYSFNERQSQRLEAIDDSLILLLCKFCNREKIIKYYRRSHLDGLKYTNSVKGTSIESTTLQFLNDYQKFAEDYGKELTLNKQFFWDKYKRIFENLLLFVTVSTSKTTNYNLIFEKLIGLLPNQNFLKKFDYSVISDFIKEKGIFFKTHLIKEFLNLAINNEKFHDEKIFNALQIQISKHHPDALINDEETFNLITTYFLKECPKCKTFHGAEILVYIYHILAIPFQQQLQIKVNSFLRSEFNQELYYKFAIHGIIDYKTFFEHYLSLLPVVKKYKKGISFFDNTVANYYGLSELLNLCFKYNVDISTGEFQKFKNISDYYDWLLDMDNFNYRKFNPKWILAYRTDSYLSRIFKNKKVHDYMKTYLKKSKDIILSQLFIYWS